MKTMKGGTLASCGGSMMSVTQVTELIQVVNRKNNPGNGTWVTSWSHSRSLSECYEEL